MYYFTFYTYPIQFNKYIFKILGLSAFVQNSAPVPAFASSAPKVGSYFAQSGSHSSVEYE